MMYRYTAYTNEKKIVRGTIESSSLETAEYSLYRAGFRRILDLQKAGPDLDLKKLLTGSSRISAQALLDFTTELAILTESGLTILAALGQLEKQSTEPNMKQVIAGLAQELQGGTPFHQALRMHPHVFNETFCSIIEANEKAGTLDNGLQQLIKQIKQQLAVRSQIQGAITQPAIIIGLAVVVVALMSIVVLPPLAGIFREFGASMPLTTKVLIGFSDFVNANKYSIVIIIACLAAVVFFVFKQPGIKPVIDRCVLKIPLIGQVVNWNNTAYFSRTLSHLLGAGILLPDSINILLRGISNVPFRDALTDVKKQLVQGQSLSAVMSQNKIFPPLLVEMIGVGETSGNLEYALGTVADYFESKVEKRISRITSLLEPVLILLVGLVVGFIAISMISTIYGLVGNY
ncbi:MAG: type II secretion system F family protein [Dehalococcoidales bacterium]|nr:type II secretion system F family protein [Dehalococcoidales bacterium]